MSKDWRDSIHADEILAGLNFSKGFEFKDFPKLLLTF